MEIQELLELQRSGLRVTLPETKKGGCETARTPLSLSLRFEDTPASFIPDPDSSLSPPQREAEAARKELLEMQLAGLHVILPPTV